MGRRKQPLNLLQALPPEAIALPPGSPPPEGEALERMELSMQRIGLRHPLLVLTLPKGKGRSQKAGYQLVVGRKRLLAAQQLAWPEVACIVLPPEAEAEAEVVTALQEGAQPPWVLGDTLHTLKTRYGWTQAQLGHALDKTRDFVANYLPIPKILPDVRAFLENADPKQGLTARHLRFVGRTPPARQMRIAQKIVGEGLSTKTLEAESGGRTRTRTRRYIKVRTHTIPPVGKSPGIGRSSAMSKPGKTTSKRVEVGLKELRKAYRQIQTDLRRLEQREQLEDLRARAAIAKARERLRLVRKEAREQRQSLQRELRRALSSLTGA